jgi:hypothetical protein
VLFGRFSLAKCGLPIARSDISAARFDISAARVELPATQSNTATIVALRISFLIRNVVCIIPSISIPGRTNKTALVQIAPVGPEARE